MDCGGRDPVNVRLLYFRHQQTGQHDFYGFFSGGISGGARHLFSVHLGKCGFPEVFEEKKKYILHNDLQYRNILKTKDNCLYYFLVAENPVGIDKQTCTPNWEKFLKNIKNPLEIRKLDHKKHPLFGILFAKTDSYSEIENILKLNMEEFFK